MNQQVTTWWGEMAGNATPRYWATADVTADGPNTFGVRFKSNPFQPDEQGGECIFKMLYLGLSWTLSGTIRITPFWDDSTADVPLSDGSVVSAIAPTFVLPASATPLRGVFPVPILRVQKRAGVEVARSNPRGQRFAFQLESSGALGTGLFDLESAQLEYQQVRKAIYLPVQAAP